MSTLAQTHLHEELQTSGYSTYQVVGVCVTIGFVQENLLHFLQQSPHQSNSVTWYQDFCRCPGHVLGQESVSLARLLLLSLGAEAGGC